MTDLYGREISYLRLSVTELCNLRCRYCMPEDGVCKKRHEEMLTQEEMLCAIRAAASLGVRKLRLTGGEPLVKPNIVALCREAAATEGIDKLTQMMLIPVFHDEYVDTDEENYNKIMEGSLRGANGFGSSDVKH